jgi:diguanylate cyclase (GGDEF)-like protein
MTGLPNRAAFEARLVESLHVARGSGMRTEILFLDLDLFKQVNDTLGHKIGDRVIAESANRLSQSVGPDAFAARWGGDEFVVLRRGRDDADAVACAERLIAELSRPMWIEGAEIRVGASAGVAACIDGRTSMETLLQHADLALYTAKREARGAVRLFEPAMNDKARERRLLELDVQAALAARSFNLRYQPIVDLETTELVSFEALAEWRHPTRGSVSPVVFVTVLEELNLMQVFGSWALQRACEDAVRWPQPARVGVNVSAKQIDTLVEAVKRALAASGLPPERLELEITETAALEGGDEARRALETVRAMGVRVALDDFGTGFSSLSHLMSLPLDKVKIDKSFTQQLGQSRKADVLVANIARLTSQLGMRVTFEGIETQEQLALTRAVGVTAEGQGWLFGRATANADLGQYFAPAKGKKAVA